MSDQVEFVVPSGSYQVRDGRGLSNSISGRALHVLRATVPQ